MQKTNNKIKMFYHFKFVLIIVSSCERNSRFLIFVQRKKRWKLWSYYFIVITQLQFNSIGKLTENQFKKLIREKLQKFDKGTDFERIIYKVSIFW